MTARRHQILWATLLGVLIVVPNLFPIQQYRSTGGYLFYSNAFDEPTYLSYDGAMMTGSPTHWAEYLVVALHRAGMSGGYMNLMFDCVVPAVTVIVLRRIALILGFSALDAIAYPFLIVSVPVLFGYANPYYTKLYNLNYSSKGLSWITLPEAYFPPFFRTPEPQVSLCIAALATYAAMLRRSYVLALAAAPFMYAFVGVPYVFTVLTMALRDRLGMRTSLAAFASYGATAAAMLVFFTMFVSGTRQADFLPPTRLPLLSGTSVAAMALYFMARSRLEPSLRVPAGVLALSPLAGANTQMITGFIQAPHNLEQGFGVVVVGILLVLALRSIPGRTLVASTAAAVSVLLLGLYSSFVFSVNASVWQRVPPALELIDALRQDPDSVVIGDADLADIFSLVAPRIHFSAFARSQVVSRATAPPGLSASDRWSNYLCVKRAIAQAGDAALPLRSAVDTLDRNYRHLNQDFPLVHLNRPMPLKDYFDPTEAPRDCAPRQLLVFPSLILGAERGRAQFPATVVTSDRQWAYAERQPLPNPFDETSHGRLADVRAMITVTSGCIGLGVLTPDGRTFVSTASLTTAPDVQLADLVYEPGPAPHSMVLHNCSRDGRSSAVVHSVQIFPVEAVTLRPLAMKNDVRNRR